MGRLWPKLRCERQNKYPYSRDVKLILHSGPHTAHFDLKGVRQVKLHDKAVELYIVGKQELFCYFVVNPLVNLNVLKMQMLVSLCHPVTDW